MSIISNYEEDKEIDKEIRELLTKKFVKLKHLRKARDYFKKAYEENLASLIGIGIGTPKDIKKGITLTKLYNNLLKNENYITETEDEMQFIRCVRDHLDKYWLRVKQISSIIKSDELTSESSLEFLGELNSIYVEVKSLADSKMKPSVIKYTVKIGRRLYLRSLRLNSPRAISTFLDSLSEEFCDLIERQD